MRPAAIAACAEATKVHAGIKQSVLGRAPNVINAKVNPCVAFEVVATISSRTPQCAAKRRSSETLRGPKFEYIRVESISFRYRTIRSAEGSWGRKIGLFAMSAQFLDLDKPTPAFRNILLK